MNRCCYLEESDPTLRCGADALWAIYHGDTEADYTEACTAHVGDLLTDAGEHRVYPLAGQQSTLDVRQQLYTERNMAVQLAALLARECGDPYDAWWSHDPDAPQWPVLFLMTPFGQLSWHIPQAEGYVRLGFRDGSWDGHTTGEKIARLQRLLRAGVAGE